MSVDWDLLIENHLEKGEKKMSLDLLMESIGEVLAEADDSFLISEQQGGGRFSVNIPIPRLVPTEAWGDPKNISRQDVDKVFSVFRKAASVKDRISMINSFLDPATARRKAPGGKVNTLLSVMQVIEALQAALNDYSESSAGFVFEGFMAALTGGRQEAGRVGGTLPIEDFITETGENVSLKLLSPKTNIHGSFTNLIDYLFVRGASEIKYLVAYKLVESSTVTELAIWDFIINRNNIVDVMEQSGNTNKTFGDKAAEVKQWIQRYEETPEWRQQMAALMSQTPGYSKIRGILLKTGDEEEEEEEEKDKKPDNTYAIRIAKERLAKIESDVEQAAKNFASGKGPDFEKWWSENVSDESLEKAGRLSAGQKNSTKKALKKAFDSASGKLSESFFGDFDAREKSLLSEAKGSSGAGGEEKDGGAQWSISGTQMQKMRSLINLDYYGQINFSQGNIDELSKIYIDKLGEDIMTILNATKEFTEKIGTYFIAENRGEAASANKEARDQGKIIVDALEKDPTGTTGEEIT